MAKTNSEIYMSIAEEDREEHDRLHSLHCVTEIWLTDKELSGDKKQRFRIFLFDTYRRIGSPRTTEHVNAMLEGKIPLEVRRSDKFSRLLPIRRYMSRRNIDFRILKTSFDGEVILDCSGYWFDNHIRERPWLD